MVIYCSRNRKWIQNIHMSFLFLFLLPTSALPGTVRTGWHSNEIWDWVLMNNNRGWASLRIHFILKLFRLNWPWQLVLLLASVIFIFSFLMNTVLIFFSGQQCVNYTSQDPLQLAVWLSSSLRDKCQWLGWPPGKPFLKGGRLFWHSHLALGS